MKLLIRDACTEWNNAGELSPPFFLSEILARLLARVASHDLKPNVEIISCAEAYNFKFTELVRAIVVIIMADSMICLNDFEEYAKQHLPKNVWGFYSTGADEEITLNENRNAFSRLKLRPRFLKDVSMRDTTCSILGNPISSPICIAPMGMQSHAWPKAEICEAQAAESMKTCIALASTANTTMEDVALGAPGALKWFQLYVWPPREHTVKLVRRAEAAGYKALVITVDVPVIGKRRRDITKIGSKNVPYEVRHVHFEYVETIHEIVDASLKWEDIDWLRSITKLPIVIKGLLTAEDAYLAVQHGASGIVVSNHGGRQLDTVPATIEALPEIVEAVDGKLEVYLDGGVRCGTDVLKALALGAKAVFIGRPVVYGLAYKGKEGVIQVLKILNEEFSVAMALTGCCSIPDIKKSLVVHQSHYSKI